MSQLADIVGRSPGRVRFTTAALLLLTLVAFAVFWIGRASARDGEPSGSAVLTAVSNVPTPKADAVDSGSEPCTGSPEFNDMPDMSKTFNLGGRTTRPVIVLFQAEWHQLGPTTAVFVRLVIDGVPQSQFPDGVIADMGPMAQGASTIETGGFNFISDPLAPGMHTATIQWRDNGAGPHCVDERTLIIMHK